MSVDFRREWTEGGYSSAHALQRENARLREMLSGAERRAAQHRTMLREADHRIKNSLQIVASLISLQAGREKDGPSCDALRTAAVRIRAVARMHDALQAGDGSGLINLGAVFEKMTEALCDMYGESGSVAVQVTAEPLLAPLTLAQPVALMVNELAINALRHGYPHGRSGVIRIGLLRTDHALRVIVADDGVGLPKDYERSTGYGMKLVQMITKQIGATLHVDSIGGARFSVIVPGDYALAGQALDAVV